MPNLCYIKERKVHLGFQVQGSEALLDRVVRRCAKAKENQKYDSEPLIQNTVCKHHLHFHT